MADADVAVVEPAGNPMALGSAFHAACQWLIEMGADALPAARADALARLWRLTPEQRERFDVALNRWLKSAVRADLLAWPCVRAEVPFFFSLGCEDEDIARYGAYAEGAIDALATDPADPSRARSLITRRVARRMRRRNSCSRSTPCRRASTPTCCTRRALRR